MMGELPKTTRLIATLTRPADTAVYAAGDAVSNADGSHLEFKAAGVPPHYSGFIHGVQVVCNANKSTKPDMELWLFAEDIANTNDNAAWAPSDAEMRTCIGKITIPSSSWYIANPASDASGNTMLENFSTTRPYKLGRANNKTQIFGQLVMRNAYTPVSSEEYQVEIYATLD